MTDAASTIKLGVETGTGKEDLVSLRQEFTKLREEVVALNSLKANAQGLVNGAQTAQSELATLGAELKSSVARVNELEQQLAKLSKSQASNAKATTDTVTAETKRQFDVQVMSARNLSNEIAAIEAKTTEKVKSEQAKRYAMTQSAKVGGVNYSMKDSSNANDFGGAVKEAERVRREILASSQSMIIAETDRAEALRREKLATSQAMVIAETERAEALRREKLAASQAMLIAETERGEALRREKLAVSQAMQVAEVDRAEALKREKNSQAQAMLIAEIDRAEKKKIEVARVAREMQIAEIDRAEAVKREKTTQAQAMIMAEIDRAEAQKRERQRTTNAMMIAEVERAEARRREVMGNAQAMLMAQIDRADEERRQKQRVANDMLIADTKRAEDERQLIMNARFAAQSPAAQVATVKGAASLHGDGTDPRRVQLASSRYGSDAVGEIRNLSQMEGELNRIRGAGASVTREAAAAHRAHADSMRDAHSAARGLAGGLGQLWVTYGSVIPLVAGAAVAGSIVKVLETGKAVEYQLQFLRALASDLERQPIDLDSFLKITDGTMSSVKDAAGGMRALAQAGLDQKQALTALPNILDLAVIGEMGVGAAALSATGVVHAFGLELNDIGHVGDVFAKVAASSNTSVQAMTESMKSASTVGEMFHVSMEEAAASIGVLAQRNITGTSAGTALTTALKNLYEPTSKAAAALKQMNISTDDGHGGLKNYTELLGELREKLAGLNDSSKAVFLGTITDQRGAKAISAITENLKEYRRFMDEAVDSTGFMSKATLQLEDTVQGSFQRMSNSMEGSFIKAFQEASPTIRQVLGDLNGFAKSETTVNLLTRLAITAANLTKTLIEHASVIGYVVAAYAGMKVLSAALNGYTALRTAVATYTLTSRAAAVASAEGAVALSIEQQAALAAGRGFIVAGTGARFLAASFGPISLIIMAAVTAYELFHSKIEQSENAQKSANNTADTVLDYYDRQINKLHELNKELSDFSEKGSKAANDAARAVIQADSDNKKTEIQRLKATGQGSMPVSFADQALVGDRAQTKLQKAEADLKVLDDKLINLDTKSKELQANQGLNKKLNDKAGVERRLDSLIRDAGGDDSDPAGNAATKLMLPKILALKDEFKSSTEAYKSVALKIVDIRKELNEKLGTFVVPKKGGESDAYRAKQADLDGELQAIRDSEKSKLSDVKSRLASHEIGDLQAVALNLQVVKEARGEEVKVMERKAKLAQDNSKLTDAQRAQNDIEKQRRASTEADNEAGRERNQTYAKWAAEDLKIAADTLRKRGELVKAFQAEFDSKNAGEVSSLNKDLNSGNLPLLDRVKASRRLDTIEGQRDTGTQAANFDELQDKFDKLHSEMEEQLATVAEKASTTNGFLSDIGAATAADDIRTKLTPALEETLAKMGEVANGLNDNALKSSVSRMSATLIKESNRSRDAWVSVGKSIEKSLSDAFGKGGKAVGGVVAALIKQREAQKDIDSDLAKSKTGDPIKDLKAQDKAREDSAALQLSSYASIAGAAKGFFDEHSKGYEAMQTAERVFRAFEMAEAVRSFLTKSGFLSSFTALFASSKATEVATEAGTVAPTLAAEGAKQTAHGITGLAAALSLPFPANIPAFAVTAAMLMAIGVAVRGGGASGASVTAQRQKDQGTGSVLGDSSAKSDSISKTLSHLSSNSDIGLKHSSAMSMSLHNIESSISGLGSLLIRGGSLTGKLSDSSNSMSDFSRKAATGIDVIFGGALATVTDKLLGGKLGQLTGKITSAVFGGKTTAEDTGLTFGRANSLGNLLSSGVNASQYTDTKTSGGWFRSDKHSTQLTDLGNEANDQFTKVLKELAEGVSVAQEAMGQSGDKFTADLKNFVVDIGEVSLKDLKGDDLQKQLNAVFSKLGDDMARYAAPGLQQFQKVGEGYFETLIRVANGVDVAEYSLEKLGVTAVKYTDVINKQGDLAAEIVRQSLVNKEATSGVGQIIKTLTGSVEDLTQAYTKLNDIRRTMRVTGISNADVTTSMIRGAGGLDNLSSGVNDYLDKFFSEAEKSAAKVAMLQDEFARMNVTMPKSIQDYKTLVNSIDRTTESGQALYGALMSVSGRFADIADTSGNINPALAKQKSAINDLIKVSERWINLQKSARSMVSDIDAALSSIGKSDSTYRITELRNLLNAGTLSFEQQLELAGELKDLALEKYQTEKQNAQSLIEYGKDLNKFVTSLKTGDLSPLTNKQKLETAKADYEQTLGNTQSSDKEVRNEARGDIQNKAQTFLDLAHTYYTSSQNYKDMFGLVTEQLGNLGMGSIVQGKSVNDLNQEQVTELKHLRDLAKSIDDTATAEHNSNVKQIGAQVTALQAISTSLGVLSGLPEILAGLPAQLSAGLGGVGISGAGVNGTGADQIEALYSSIFHRQSDEGGLDFWKKAYASGTTIDQVKSGFLSSDEYKLVNGSHAGGLDYVPFDGYVAELHRGERILTATEARRTNKAEMASTSSFTDGERAEMASEIAELKRVMEKVIESQDSNTKTMVRAIHGSNDQAAEKIVQGTKEAVSKSDYDQRNKPAYQ